MLHRSLQRRVGAATATFVVLTALITGSGLGAGAQEGGAAEPAFAFQGEGEGSLDLDARGGRASPARAQRADAADLDAAVTWNRFGTPASLVPTDGEIAGGLPGDAVEAARAFIVDNAELFRLG